MSAMVVHDFPAILGALHEAGFSFSGPDAAVDCTSNVCEMLFRPIITEDSAAARRLPTLF
jgi:hypothetical protein